MQVSYGATLRLSKQSPHSGRGNRLRDAVASRGYAAGVMAEIAIGLFIVGVLFIADPDRLQMVLDQLRELAAWLAE